MPIPTDVHARFTSPLDSQQVFHRMEAEEEPGRPSRYDPTRQCERGDLGLGDLLGQIVTVELNLPTSAPRGASIFETCWG